MKQLEVGDVLLYRPRNCPYLSVAQLCAKTVLLLNDMRSQWPVRCYCYYDYILTEEKDFEEQIMLKKRIIALSPYEPSAQYKNLGNFPLHKEIPLDLVTRLPPPIKVISTAGGFGVGTENTLTMGSDGTIFSIYFGYETGPLAYTAEYNYFLWRDINVVSSLLNNPSVVYETIKIGGGTDLIYGRYSNGFKTEDEIYRETGGYVGCKLDSYPMLYRLSFKTGDLFRVPLSNGHHCIGQLIYYDDDIGPVIALFKDSGLYFHPDNRTKISSILPCPHPDNLLTIAAIMPWHFRWNLWPIYDNFPLLIDYDFTEAIAKRWDGWERYDSGHIQQFVEACHGLTKWQKDCFDKLLLNKKFKPEGIEEVEIELEYSRRLPLFEESEEQEKLWNTPPPPPVQMTTAKFWKIIAESKEKAGGDSEKQMEILTEMLAATSLKEIQKFNNRFYSYFFKSYTWDLWGAAFVAMGGCSDDSFMDFRGWLIAQGKEVFEAALKEPESLVDYAPLENPGIMEGFSYCASDAYGELGGGELDFDASWVTNSPRGEFWVEAWLPKRFPRLWQKFGKRNTNAEKAATVNTTDTPATESNDFSNPDLELIKKLITETPDINAILENGKTPLLYAAAKNPDSEAIKLIIAAGAEVNYLTEDGNSPLIYAAAKNQNPEVIKVLISAGADINIANKNGFTALMHAAEYSNNPEIINTLITAGANVNAENHSIPESESVITALTLASSCNTNSEVIAALVKAGADANVNQKHGGLTPLMFAALKNPEPEVIRVLAEAGADLNVEVGGATALNFASQNENPAVAKMLMSLTQITDKL